MLRQMFRKGPSIEELEAIERREREQEIQNRPEMYRPDGMDAAPVDDKPLGEEPEFKPLISGDSRSRTKAIEKIAINGFVSRTLSRPVTRVNLGASWHSIMLGDHIQTCRTVLEEGKNTCCKCGICIPGFCQVHHLDDNHTNNARENLAPICSYCHDIEHPLWAGACGRIRFIAAPDIDQKDLTCLAWAVTMSSLLDLWIENQSAEQLAASPLSNAQQDKIRDMSGQAAAILADIDQRSKALKAIIGDTHPEVFFESVNMAGSLAEESDFRQIVDMLDKIIRVWPEAAGSTYRDERLPVSAKLSAWKGGQFTDMADILQNDLLAGKAVSLEAVLTVFQHVAPIIEEMQ